MSSITYDKVIDQLIFIVPEFAIAYKEDLDEETKGLHHVVFGFLTRFIVDEFRKGHSTTGSAFDRALQFLEEAMKSQDVEVQNLVWCSFLENLHVAGDDYAAIKGRLGKELQKTLRKIV